MLLKIMSLEVKLPITLRVDHLGEIFMSENVTTSNRTKHADNQVCKKNCGRRIY